MAVVGGKYSVVNGIGGMRQWSLSETSAPKKAIASNTRGGPARRPGIEDWSGNVQAYGGLPSAVPGAAFEFAGYCGPTSGVEGTNGDVYSGTAIVDSVVINWNYESGDIISHVINFSSNGGLNKLTGIYTDVTEPDFISASELASIEADGEEICRVTTMVLTLMAENKSYINSCTDGGTRRLPGNFDATLAIGMQDTNLEEFIASIGDSLEMQLPIDATRFWLLRWMLLKDFSGLSVNRESGDVIGFTANFEFNGFVDGDAGAVVTPDEVDLWGDSSP